MTDVKSRLPASYKPAEWRCTMPFDAASGRVGVGFDLMDGQTVRLALSLEAVRHVIETLQQSEAQSIESSQEVKS